MPWVSPPRPIAGGPLGAGPTYALRDGSARASFWATEAVHAAVTGGVILAAEDC